MKEFINTWESFRQAGAREDLLKDDGEQDTGHLQKVETRIG